MEVPSNVGGAHERAPLRDGVLPLQNQRNERTAARDLRKSRFLVVSDGDFSGRERLREEATLYLVKKATSRW
jgi:hypothetical protein